MGKNNFTKQEFICNKLNRYLDISLQISRGLRTQKHFKQNICRVCGLILHQTVCILQGFPHLIFMHLNLLKHKSKYTRIIVIFTYRYMYIDVLSLNDLYFYDCWNLIYTSELKINYTTIQTAETWRFDSYRKVYLQTDWDGRCQPRIF